MMPVVTCRRLCKLLLAVLLVLLGDNSELELCKLGELHTVMNAKKSMMNLYCRTGQQLNGKLTDWVELFVDPFVHCPIVHSAARSGPFKPTSDSPMHKCVSSAMASWRFT